VYFNGNPRSPASAVLMQARGLHAQLLGL